MYKIFQSSTSKRTISFLLATSLLLATCVGCRKQGESNVTILYTTDAHGRIVTDDETIGLDVVAAIKKNTENSVLVDAGDYLHGTPIAERTQGEDVIAIMKETGYTAAAIGEADFSYGLDVLKDRVKQAKEGGNSLRLLSANVRGSDGSEPFEPYSIMKVDGLKIGFFGISTEEMDPGTFGGVTDEIQFEDVATQAKNMVDALKNKGCKVIVALSHLGNQRKTENNSIALVQQVDGVDIVIDGHTHRTAEISVMDSLVVSSGNYGANVGQITIQYDHSKDALVEKKNTLIRKESTLDIEPDEDVSNRIKNLEAVESSNQITHELNE